MYILYIDVKVVEMEKYSKVSNDQLIFSIQELKDKGLSYYKISQLVKQGIFIKLNKKYYENTNFDGEESDFYYAYAYVQNDVICLLSAAVYYNLSTCRPDAIDIAIPRKARVSTLPEWPELNIYYFTDERFSVGAEIIEVGKNKFRIYDIEKTVTDIVFYREKMGIEETKEVLTNYLHRKDRNLNKLIRYAEILKCRDIINKYLEVLI